MISTPRSFRYSRLATGIVRTFCHRQAIMTVTLAAGSMGVQAQEVEEIQITGTRIIRTTMETPTPVTTIQASELASMAPGNLIDGLTQMPQFSNNQTPEQVNGGQNSGGSNVNLRGAGSNRTLTLLDGRRVVPSNRFGTVDVNLFPEDLLRSVETVTGGASASYGTDAVAGVVNFILDTDYVGFKTHAQTGITEYGDGQNYEVGLAFGQEFGNGLHLLGSLAVADQRAISSLNNLRDRDFFNATARVTNPDPNGPTEIIRPWTRPTNFNNTGVLIDAARPALNRLEFRPDGSLVPMAFNGVGTLNTGCMCYSDPANGYGVNADTEISNEFQRYNGFVYLDYDLGENLNVFLQGIYAENDASDRRESISLLSGWQGRIYPDNAFLRPEVSALLLANGISNADGYNALGQPNGGIGYGFFPQNVVDTPLGESRQETNNEMYSVTGGFNYEFTGGWFDGWNLNAYYQYGENVQDFVTTNGVRVDRLQLAMEAVRHSTTGEIICRVNLPQYTGPISAGGNGGLFSDCAPINTFGGVGNISEAAADYVMDRNHKIARQWTDQHFAELVLTGELFEGFGAGPVDAAFGASYRKESFEQRTLDPADEFPAQVNGTLLSAQGLMPPGIRGIVPQGNTSVPGYNGIPGLRFVPAGYLGDGNSSSVLFSSLREIVGGYDVKEAFAEVNVPLLNGRNLIDNLETSLAARWADYEGSGEIWAWKAGLNWTLNDELRFRATRSRDVRAASLRERFDQTRGGINVRNPWDNSNVVSAASLSGGNPNVQPEEADTITLGFVYQPTWLDGFSASLDWYEIDINGALAQLANQNIVDSCRTGDLTLCQYVITPNGPVTNPTSNEFRQIDRVEAIFINLANQLMSGMDMELSYRTDVNLFSEGSEQLGLRFLASWLDENSIQNQGAVRDERVGQIGGNVAPFPLPEYKVTTSITYAYDNYSGFLQGRWIDGGLLDRTYLESAARIPASARPADSNLALCGANVCTIDDNSVPSAFYLDLRVGGTFGDDGNLEVYANVNNLLDRQPPLAPGTVGRTGIPLGVIAGLYDTLGRRYTIGVNYEFAGL